MIAGGQLGHLTLLHEGPRTPRRQRRWLCLCDCGREVLKCEYNLQKGQGLSCGECYTSEFGTLKRARQLDVGQQILATTWLPWALDRARKWQRRWPGLEDEIESAAQYGLVLGVGAFDAARNPNLELFLLRRVLSTIRRAIRDERRRMATPVRLVSMAITAWGSSPRLERTLDRLNGRWAG